MISSEVTHTIEEWTSWAAKSGVERYDIALFKIWISFEKFLSDLFIQYSLGLPSEKEYFPKLNIQFKSEEQFNAFMREGNKQYIEYIDRITKLSKHIFEVNPFDSILSDSIYQPAMEEIKALRNYIAHESGESRRKLLNTCFSGNEKNFLEPNDYLKSKEKNTKKSYFTYYTDCIKEMTEILISEPNE